MYRWLIIAFTAAALHAQTGGYHFLALDPLSGTPGQLFMYDPANPPLVAGTLYAGHTDDLLVQGAYFNGANYTAVTSTAMTMALGPNIWALSYTSALTPTHTFTPATPYGTWSPTELFLTKNITIQEVAAQSTDVIDIQDNTPTFMAQWAASGDLKLIGSASGAASLFMFAGGSGGDEWQIEAATGTDSVFAIANVVGTGNPTVKVPGLKVTGAFTLAGGDLVLGSGGNIWEIKTLTLSGNSDLSIGNTTGSGTPAVEIQAIIDAGYLTVGGDATVTGNYTINGTGTSTMAGALSISKTLGVTLGGTFASTLNVSGLLTAAGGLTVASGLTVSSGTTTVGALSAGAITAAGVNASGYAAGGTSGITSATCTHWKDGLCDTP